MLSYAKYIAIWALWTCADWKEVPDGGTRKRPTEDFRTYRSPFVSIVAYTLGPEWVRGSQQGPVALEMYSVQSPVAVLSAALPFDF